MSILWFFIGLATLVVGAEALVRGASNLSLSSGISPLALLMQINQHTSALLVDPTQ